MKYFSNLLSPGADACPSFVTLTFEGHVQDELKILSGS